MVPNGSKTRCGVGVKATVVLLFLRASGVVILHIDYSLNSYVFFKN